MSAADVADFRQAMSRVGAAVHVITTADEAGRHGLTASAVCSVTDAPPTLLFCMNRQVFADRTKVAERFEHGRWTTGASGAPMLDGAAACFDGLIADIVDVGTHSVIFVEVITARSEDAPVLMYMGRSYHQLPHLNELTE